MHDSLLLGMFSPLVKYHKCYLLVCSLFMGNCGFKNLVKILGDIDCRKGRRQKVFLLIKNVNTFDALFLQRNLNMIGIFQISCGKKRVFAHQIKITFLIFRKYVRKIFTIVMFPLFSGYFFFISVEMNFTSSGLKRSSRGSITLTGTKSSSTSFLKTSGIFWSVVASDQ